MTPDQLETVIARYQHRIVSLEGERLGLIRSVTIGQDADIGQPTYLAHLIGTGTDAIVEVHDIESLIISETVTEELLASIHLAYRREIARAIQEYGPKDRLTLLLVGWHNWFKEDEPETRRVNGLVFGGPG